MSKPYRILPGDCLRTLRTLPAQSVHCVVTSPPYFWLRDYGTGTWRGGDPDCQHQLGHQHKKECRCGARYHDRQVGLERTPEAFAHRLVKIFREVRRVLRDDGTVWLNLGDSYNSPGTMGPTSEKSLTGEGMGFIKRAVRGVKYKDLFGIPWLVAFALRADGWYLRADIIWAKSVSFCPTYVGGVMPSAVTDRPTKSHEYLFLLSKQPKYYYDKYAIAEPLADATIVDGRFKRAGDEETPYGTAVGKGRGLGRGSRVDWTGTRNVRSVWTIPLAPSREEHFAQFPHKLVTPCIQASTSEHGCCPKCGTPWTRPVRTHSPDTTAATDDVDRRGTPHIRGKSIQSAKRVSARVFSTAKLGEWQPSCRCGRKRAAVPCTVLDPFSGSGTTGIVALKLRRRYLGLELSRKYVRISKRRLRRAAQSPQAQLEPLFPR